MGAQRRVFRGGVVPAPWAQKFSMGPRSCISLDFLVDAASGSLPKSKEALGLISS